MKNQNSFSFVINKATAEQKIIDNLSSCFKVKLAHGWL